MRTLGAAWRGSRRWRADSLFHPLTARMNLIPDCAMPEFMAAKAQSALPPIREWRNVTLRQFEAEVVPRNEPAVLRGLVDHWPATAAARESLESIRTYLSRLD